MFISICEIDFDRINFMLFSLNLHGTMDTHSLSVSPHPFFFPCQFSVSPQYLLLVAGEFVVKYTNSNIEQPASHPEASKITAHQWLPICINNPNKRSSLPRGQIFVFLIPPSLRFHILFSQALLWVG